LNSETIIVGICCLLLATAFFLFKSQLFIFLNRLAKIEFRGAENLQIKIKAIVPKYSKPWTWYKVWANTLLHPRTATGEALVSEGSISFRQAILWLTLASFIEAVISQPIFAKSPFITNWQNIFKLIGNILLSSLVFPLCVFIFCVVIHFIAKLFGSKGTLRNFFIVYASFIAPLWILLGLSLALGLGTYKFEAFVLIGAFLEFYWLIVINSVVIKSVYRFSWAGTCLISALIMIGGFLLILFFIYFSLGKHPY